MTEDDLDDADCQEPSWASMIAMSKGEMVWTGARELGHPFPGGNGAHLQKAISIPLFRVLVQIRIPHSRRIHIDSRASLQRDSIGERDVFFNASSHGRFGEASSQPLVPARFAFPGKPYSPILVGFKRCDSLMTLSKSFMLDSEDLDQPWWCRTSPISSLRGLIMP